MLEIDLNKQSRMIKRSKDAEDESEKALEKCQAEKRELVAARDAGRAGAVRAADARSF